MSTPPDAVHYLLDPSSIGLRHPVALVAFGGWTDAGGAGTGAVRHLISALSAEKLAEIEPDEFYSFTDTRPLTSVVGGNERTVQWPLGEFYAGRLPEPAERDLLLFVAPEPNLRWRGFCGAMLDVMQRVETGTVMSLGAILGMVHHRATVPLTGWATEPQMRELLVRHSVSFPNYEGPTGFVTVLVAEAQARGIPAAALLGFSPNYIQGVPNPRVSHALLRMVRKLTGLELPLSELERSGRALSRQVDKLLSSQPELQEQVDRMLTLLSQAAASPAAGEEEEHDPPESAASPSSEPVDLPSGQAVVKELEDFLRQLRQKEEDPPPDAG